MRGATHGCLLVLGLPLRLLVAQGGVEVHLYPGGEHRDAGPHAASALGPRGPTCSCQSPTGGATSSTVPGYSPSETLALRPATSRPPQCSLPPLCSPFLKAVVSRMPYKRTQADGTPLMAILPRNLACRAAVETKSPLLGIE